MNNMYGELDLKKKKKEERILLQELQLELSLFWNWEQGLISFCP